MNSRTITASAEIQIQFYDLDPMNVAWHGNYVKYMETARCALLDKIHYDYFEMEKKDIAFKIEKCNKRVMFGPLCSCISNTFDRFVLCKRSA